MEPFLPISNLNDFLFCPASIYYHNLVQDSDRIMSNTPWQYRGAKAHSNIDEGNYSTRSDVLSGVDVCSVKYSLIGRIDVFDIRTGVLTERKRHVKVVYDGFIFQLYAQCLCLREMGHEVMELKIHSLDDNRSYDIPLPEDDRVTFERFLGLLEEIRQFDITRYCLEDPSKCHKCIYSSICSMCDVDDITF